MLSYLKRSIRRHTFEGGGGDSGGGGGGGTSITTQELPPELRPLATAYTSKAIGLSGQPYTPYSGQRYSGLNPTQNLGLSMQENRAMSGSPLTKSASNYATSMIGGNEKTAVGVNPYLGANPYLEGAINRSMNDVQGRVTSQFGGSNYGTTANQDVLSRSLGDTSSAMRMQDYGWQQQLAESGINRNLQAAQQDTSNRMAAAQYAPTLANQDYYDINQLMNAGQIRQDQDQQGKDFAYQQFIEERDKPYKDLASMAGVFGTNLGGTSKTESTQSGGGGGGK